MIPALLAGSAVDVCRLAGEEHRLVLEVGEQTFDRLAPDT
jgi:hypothetical protein